MELNTSLRSHHQSLISVPPYLQIAECLLSWSRDPRHHVWLTELALPYVLAVGLDGVGVPQLVLQCLPLLSHVVEPHDLIVVHGASLCHHRLGPDGLFIPGAVIRGTTGWHSLVTVEPQKSP